MEIQAFDTGEALLNSMDRGPIDAIVLGCEVPDMSLPALAEQILSSRGAEVYPIILNFPADVGPDRMAWLQRFSQEFSLEIADSPTQLASELVRLSCIPVGKLSEACQKVLRDASDPAHVLAGKKVLIVDDDIRNIFALTSILERYDMVTVSAETGHDAINLLQAAPDVDIVLMDIMMPEMDGLDTTRAIRQISRFRNLPIVAVTAKAMKGDREKCIEAGAWDYLSKPVDSEQMLSVLRAWLTV